MSIIKFVKTLCVQTAVYWEPMGYYNGSQVYNTPREILCRWDWKERLHDIQNGGQYYQKGQLLIMEDLKMEGWLKLGPIEENGLTVMYQSPLEVKGAYQIVGIDKVPLVKSTTEFVRIIIFGFRNA